MTSGDGSNSNQLLRDTGVVRGSPSEHGSVILATHAMGTRFELILCEAAGHAVGSDESMTFLRSVGEQTIEEIESCDRMLSRFATGGVPTRLMNTAKERCDGMGRFVPLDSRVFSLLRYCESMRVATGGAFDLSYESNRVRPVAIGIEFDAATCSARLSDARQTLDFGAVGKGFALDCVAELLREHGVTRAFVHGGTSSMLAMGEWNVAVRLDEHRTCRVRVLDAHLSVSSTKHRAHIVDARINAGDDAEKRMLVTAVLSPLCTPKERLSSIGATYNDAPGPGTLAEAWSTALAVVGTRPESVPRSLTTLIAREASRPEIIGPDAQCFDMNR